MINWRITTTLAWDPSWKAEEVAPYTTKTLMRIGNWWQGRVMPFHFEEFAGPKYGYEPRTRGYTMRKFKKFGHRRPLVWSTAFKTAARAGRIGVRGKNRQEVRLIFRGGFAERRRELFARTGGENAAIVKMLEDRLYVFFAGRVPPHEVGAPPTGSAMISSPGDVAGD